MAIKEKTLSPQQKMLMGAYYAAKPLNNTAWLNLFEKTTPLMSKTKTLEIDFIKSRNQVADVVKKGAKGRSSENQEYFTKKVITPGDIYQEIELSWDELSQMQAGETEVFIIGGQAVKTGEQLAARKTQWLKTAVNNAKNMMCADVVNNGIAYNTDKTDYLDYGIPSAVSASYTTNDYLLDLLSEHFLQYRKQCGMSQDRTLIGADVARQMLKDSKMQDTMYKLGYTNSAKDLTADEMALIIGTFLGKKLEQMDISPDRHGVDIIPGNVIKMINTSKLTMGYAAIGVKATADSPPESWLGDIWVDIDTGTKSIPKSVLFARSGAFPIVLDANSIYTLNLTLA